MSKTSIAFLWIFAILASPIILVLIGIRISEFIRELRYLNTEIARTSGEQRRHWLRCRRRLWLSLLPFVRY